MKLPAIIVNFKVYEQATGESALALAKIHQQVAKETGASIGVAVNFLDLAKVVENVDIPVFAQHCDSVQYGNHTGYIGAQQLKEMGVYGTLLNHAEHRLGHEVLGESILRAKEAGLYVVVCSDTPEKGKEILTYDPDLIAVEPPELIGGDISVSKSGPHIIEKAVELIGENKLLVGAGIRDPEDVQIALSLGACGVLLSSGVVKSADPYSVLMALVSGLG